MATMFEDPWKNIEPPTAIGVLNTRRVDSKGRWEFFWGRSADQRCLLVLKHSVASAQTRRIPNVQGISVAESQDEAGACALILGLEDGAHKDIFHHLCRDIISSTSNVESESDAVGRVLSRIWRWHHLLRGGPGGLLEEEQQRGLIGELLFLRERLLPNVSPIDAVTAWTGPLGSPKDFEVEQFGVEVKARRGTSRPFISISSEHQLDDGGTVGLFLSVREIGRASEDAQDGQSLTQVAKAVRNLLAADALAAELLDARLNASGFEWEADYSSTCWRVSRDRVYRVTNDFPRIVGSGLMSGVREVRYLISLAECEPFLEPEERLPRFIRRAVGDGP